MAMSETEQGEANEAWRQAEVASVPSGEGSSRGSTIQLFTFLFFESPRERIEVALICPPPHFLFAASGKK